MSKNKFQKILIFISLFLIGIIFWLKYSSKSVPGEKFAREFLVRKAGEEQIDAHLEQFRTIYWNLYQHRQIPKNRILRIHLDQAILPVLAFYQVLLPINNGDKQKTIQEIEGVVRTWILKTTRYFISPLRFFSHPFRIFRPGFEIVMKLFPAAGFDIDYLEKSEDRVAFDIKGCFFFQTLTHYGIPELTPVFCAADEAMAELFPPSICFQRTQTLGRGGACCDFRYYRKL
jgi:hypothetical protein